MGHDDPTRGSGKKVVLACDRHGFRAQARQTLWVCPKKHFRLRQPAPPLLGSDLPRHTARHEPAGSAGRGEGAGRDLTAWLDRSAPRAVHTCRVMYCWGSELTVPMPLARPPEEVRRTSR